MAENQQVEAKVKLVIDGSAVRAMDAVTKATKQASTAEEEYQKKLKDRTRIVRENERAARAAEEEFTRRMGNVRAGLSPTQSIPLVGRPGLLPPPGARSLYVERTPFSPKTYSRHSPHARTHVG